VQPYAEDKANCEAIASTEGAIQQLLSMVGLAFFTHIILQLKHIHLMTASMLHVTNRTPGSGSDNPTPWCYPTTSSWSERRPKRWHP
jgi:hypothetical protein